MGTAGIQNVAMIILADSVSLKEQAVNTSIFQLMNGVGYSMYPFRSTSLPFTPHC